MFKYDEDKMLDHINNKWINKVCPYCGHSDWNFDSRIYTPVEVHDGYVIRMQGENNLLPLVAVTCLNCGNTVFVNAIASGCITPNYKVD